jgi:hypothetical protein
MVLVKQRLEEVDTDDLWEYKLSGVAADEEALQQVEAAVGMRLDPEHRDFPDELLGSPHFTAAHENLLSMEDEALSECGEAPHHLLPIAATGEDLDLFLIAGPEARNPGQVFWYAGGLRHLPVLHRVLPRHGRLQPRQDPPTRREGRRRTERLASVSVV